jgi:drug/metabolite transporter (DMT)-like permease
MATVPSPAPGRAVTASGNLQAIGLYVVAMGLLSVMDALIKWLSADYHTFQILAFRSLFGLVPILALVMVAQGGLAALKTRRPGAHLLRGAIVAVTASLVFFALGRLPLADAYALFFAAPLFLTALSGPLLGEAVGPRRWLAVLVGFGGVLLMLRPGSGGVGGLIDIGALAALAGALGYAVFGALTRLHSRTESQAALTVWATVVVAVAMLAILPAIWVTPTPVDWALLIATGLTGGLGSICVVRAFMLAPLSVVAPFEYTAMAWGVALGFLIWGDLPDAFIWGGTAIVVASGLYILYRENRQKDREDGAEAVTPTAPLAAPAARTEAVAAPDDRQDRDA